MPVCTPYTGSGIPVGSGIPPWGFHGGQRFSHGQSGYAHGWGDFSFARRWITGRICQTVSGRGPGTGSIVLSVGPHMSYHSHTAFMWGYEGNLIKTSIRVIGSTDPLCKVGTKGRVVMYASYNGVRSDSMQFRLGRGCRDQSHLYHGPQIDAQVPPL